MSELAAELVICGAGIGGIATAYHLATKYGLENVLIVDREAPLSVTSDKSFEGYRNWWPGPDDAMVKLTNDSIAILEALYRDHPDYVQMDRQGYVFSTIDIGRADEIMAAARESCDLGAGELRIHDGTGSGPDYIPASAHGVWDAPDGADVILDKKLIQAHFPHLRLDTAVVLHARTCGWFSARNVGTFMLDQARERGGRLFKGEVVDVQFTQDRVAAVVVRVAGEEITVATSRFVIAAGPHQKAVAAMVGVDLPVYAELHAKVSIEDHERALPRDLPITVSLDRIYLDWDEEERALFAEDDEMNWLLAELPDMAVARADGGENSNIILLQWNYLIQPNQPVLPIPEDPNFPDYVLRGVSKMLPALDVYKERLRQPYVDGGYYVRTVENRPIIGPISDYEGVYIIGALSGSGMQLAPAGGELLADHIMGGQLPPYAQAFRLERFDDPAYLALLETWGATGSI